MSKSGNCWWNGFESTVNPSRFYILATGFAGALAVVLGAFGAHGLEEMLMENGLMDVWKTASMYHLVHSVVLLVLLGWRPFPVRVWWFFLVGICIFSGTLYLMGITNWRWLGAVTPVGGTAFIIAWVMLAFSFKERELR